MAQKKKGRQPGQRVGFHSGEIVPISGLWRLDHRDCPDGADLWLRRQALFPPCPHCGLTASFFLIEEVPHISEDPDFQ